MDGALLAGALFVGLGVALAVGGFMARARAREHELATLIGLPFGEQDVDLRDVTVEHGTVVTGAVGLADHAIKRWDRSASLRTRLERADLAIRPAEVVVTAAALGIALAALAAFATGQLWTGLVVLCLVPLLTRTLLDVLARRRAARFAAQLPDALTLVASSLTAGHTFLRSLQLMADEYDAPLSDEFRRVVNETQLGSPLVDSLERLAARIDMRDLDWMVEAIRIQQSVGGQLAELLATLADFMRARDEVRREIAALTAEGRVSAWVLGALPVLLVVAVQVINPGYLDPLFKGWGLVWLGATFASITAGMWMILRMVRSVEV